LGKYLLFQFFKFQQTLGKSLQARFKEKVEFRVAESAEREQKMLREAIYLVFYFSTLVIS
jgi:hypothetical protein